MKQSNFLGQKARKDRRPRQCNICGKPTKTRYCEPCMNALDNMEKENETHPDQTGNPSGSTEGR